MTLPDPSPHTSFARESRAQDAPIRHLDRLHLLIPDCPWRVGAARKLEWRDYSAADGALTLRRAANKTKRPQQIPVDAEHTPELMAILERQHDRRRPDCPFIFHGRNCGTVRLAKDGSRRPCLGNFRKVWDTACTAIAMAGRTPHDLRRSGVKHYIDAGVDPHTVMLWSGHRTEAMARRGKRIAAVALARRIAGILYAMWRDGCDFVPAIATGPTVLASTL